MLIYDEVKIFLSKKVPIKIVKKYFSIVTQYGFYGKIIEVVITPSFYYD